MDYSKYNIIIVLFFLSGCTFFNARSNQFESFKEELYSRYEIDLSSDIRRVFILTEEDCITCNRYFAKLIEDYQNDQESILIINAKGSQVDISTFIQMERESTNIYVDRAFTGNSSFLNATKVVYLKEQDIDTIIDITAKDLDKQFDYISKN